MRKFLSDLIFRHTDPKEQLREAEELVTKGELQEFRVGDERVTFIDPKGDPKKEAVLHLDTLHKLQGNMGIAESLGKEREVASYRDAIQRLHEMYPDMAKFERQYQERYSQMKERR